MRTTAQGQATDASFWHYAARDCKTEDVGFTIEITKSRATLYANSLICSVYTHRAHSGEVYDDTVVAECTAAHIVAATTNRHQQIVRAAEIDSSK